MNNLSGIDACRYVRPYEVPFRDIDMFQHVNNVAYLTWCEDIRIRYFEDVIGRPVKSDQGMIIVRMEYHFLKQVYYMDNMRIGARTTRLGTKSFDLHYEIYNDTRSERAGWGVSALVAYDYAAKHSIAIPPSWRERMAEFEIVKPEQKVAAG